MASDFLEARMEDVKAVRKLASPEIRKSLDGVAEMLMRVHGWDEESAMLMPWTIYVMTVICEDRDRVDKIEGLLLKSHKRPTVVN